MVVCITWVDQQAVCECVVTMGLRALPRAQFCAGMLLSWLALTLSVAANEDEVKMDKGSALPPCDFAAIFNFGDSNSDTGCMSAAFYPIISPSGETFFHEPVGRASDGRLIIDFIADHLGLPFLNAYIDSIGGSSYQHGANFAAGSSTVRRQNRTFFDGGTPFTLEIQTAQFYQFKSRTSNLYNEAKKHSFRKRFPRPEDYDKAIFTMDIGQNDIAAVTENVGKEDSHAVISDIVEQLATRVQFLYGQGARTFWVHNTGPIGCLPATLQNIHDPPPGYLDHNGCINYQNELAKEFNEKLKNVVVTLRAKLPDASFTYVDIFSAKYELISNAKMEGFVDADKICCGYREDGENVSCGNKGRLRNGTEVFAGSCEDPSSYVSWDGVHYTEAANQWIAKRIVNGSFSDPPVPITLSCHSQMSVFF